MIIPLKFQLYRLNQPSPPAILKGTVSRKYVRFLKGQSHEKSIAFHHMNGCFRTQQPTAN